MDWSSMASRVRCGRGPLRAWARGGAPAAPRPPRRSDKTRRRGRGAAAIRARRPSFVPAVRGSRGCGGRAGCTSTPESENLRAGRRAKGERRPFFGAGRRDRRRASGQAKTLGVSDVGISRSLFFDKGKALGRRRSTLQTGFEVRAARSTRETDVAPTSTSVRGHALRVTITVMSITSASQARTCSGRDDHGNEHYRPERGRGHALCVMITVMSITVRGAGEDMALRVMIHGNGHYRPGRGREVPRVERSATRFGKRRPGASSEPAGAETDLGRRCFHLRSARARLARRAGSGCDLARAAIWLVPSVILWIRDQAARSVTIGACYSFAILSFCLWPCARQTSM